MPTNAHAPRHAIKVQQGHSSGEQCLYAAMWQAGSKVSEDFRLLIIGWGRLGQLANLTPGNARIACGRLIEKLAVEVIAPEDSAKRTGRTYRIWSYKKVVERRKEAGLEWYTKTRGVEFVRPGPDQPTARARWDAFHRTVTETVTVPESVTMPDSETGARFDSIRTTVPDSGRDSLKQFESIESSHASSSMVAAIARDLVVDDDVARHIVRRTLAVAPDFTERHIVGIAQAKIRQMGRGGIRNAPGFLMTAIPEAAGGALGDQVRDAIAKDLARERRDKAWAVLDQPESSPESKAEARRILEIEPREDT